MLRTLLQPIILLAALGSHTICHSQAPVSHTHAIESVTVKSGKSGYLGVSLTREPLDYGTITAITATTVTDSSATYTGLTGPLALQILTGNDSGKTVQVTSVSGSVLTVAEDLTPFAVVGDKFMLVNEWTLNTFFGNPGVGGNPSGLIGGSGFSTISIDNVQLVDPITGAATTYWYKNSAPSGWRASSSPITDVGDTRIGFNDGAIVNRKTAGDLTIDLKGVIRIGRTIKTLEATGGGHNGINIITITNPAGVTLNASGLGSLVTGGISFSSTLTDRLQVKDSNGDTKTYWYKTTSPTGWRLTTAPPNVDYGGVMIFPGASVVLQRVAGTDSIYIQDQIIAP